MHDWYRLHRCLVWTGSSDALQVMEAGNGTVLILSNVMKPAQHEAAKTSRLFITSKPASGRTASSSLCSCMTADVLGLSSG